MASLDAAEQNTMASLEQNMAVDPPEQGGPEPLIVPPEQGGQSEPPNATTGESSEPIEPIPGTKAPGEGGVEIVEPPDITGTKMKIKKGIDMTKRRPKRTKEERREAARLAKIELDKEEAIRKIKAAAEEKERLRLVEIFKLDYNEENLLYELATKFYPPDVSDLKIHVKMDEKKWKTVMDGKEFMEYLKGVDKFSAKNVAHYLHRLGRRYLSNEAKWIEMVCGDGIPNDDSTVEYFFALLSLTLKREENKHLLNELRYKSYNIKHKTIEPLLLQLVKDGYFRRDLIDFCCALDDRRAFRWKDKLQKIYIKSFHFYYKTEEEFQAKLLELAEKLDVKGASGQEEKPQLMET